MTTTSNQPSERSEWQLIMVADSTLNEFTFGPFMGWGGREEAKPQAWDANTQTMRPAVKAHWRIAVEGVDGAWREVHIPLKRGRSLRQAILLACAQFKSPGDIRPDKHGYLGGKIEIQDPA